MALEEQEQISEITENPVITVLAPIWHFFAAVFWGALAGSMAILIGFGFPPITPIESLLSDLWFTGLIVTVFTFFGMLMIGLPVTWVIYLLNAEKTAVFAALGAIAGLTVLPLLFADPGSLATDLFPEILPGGLAGLACAYRWGSWRERVAKARQAERANLAAQRRTNPIHELIH
ncbi:hypothetical protein ACRAQ6_05425 [Erythrobacter sp. HA6-11]